MGLHDFSEAERVRGVVPLADVLERHHKDKPFIVGIQGGQGTGKTTLVAFLKEELERRGFRVVSFSLDDFYLSWRERQKLMQTYTGNPFYQIPRGMPGTHRVVDLKKALNAIKRGKNFSLPVFDKSLHRGAGDIIKMITIGGKVDFVLFEGWCVGIPVVSSLTLQTICRRYKIPLRALDPTMIFHQVVLREVKKYQALWRYLDYQVMIKPSSVSVHQKWRLMQERQLKKQSKMGMTTKEVVAFVQPFLPFTYVCYDKLKPDVIFRVNERHTFYKVEFVS